MNRDQQVSVLRPGHYYGSTTRRRTVSEVLLTEAIYPVGHLTPAHTHERAYFAFSRSDSQDPNAIAQTGSPAVIFHPPGSLHSGQVRTNGGTSFFVELSPRFFQRVDEQLKLQNKSIAFHAGLTTRLFASLYQEFQRTDPASEIAVEGLVLEMLAQCSRRVAESATRREPRFIKEACEIIHEHYADKLSLSGIASLLDLHPVYLATEFRRCFHCSVGDYIRRMRIDAACREIAQSSKPLADIAVALGFSHQAHFTRTFKDHVGLTPSAYRKHFRNT